MVTTSSMKIQVQIELSSIAMAYRPLKFENNRFGGVFFDVKFYWIKAAIMLMVPEKALYTLRISGDIMAKRGFLGISVPLDEDRKVEELAKSQKLGKASMARALMRAGQLMFKENPQLVLTYASFTRTTD
ncbi:MAG: hypothetical protein ACE14P_06305 [Methanotrichaceae archaeon]